MAGGCGILGGWRPGDIPGGIPGGEKPGDRPGGEKPGLKPGLVPGGFKPDGKPGLKPGEKPGGEYGGDKSGMSGISGMSGKDGVKSPPAMPLCGSGACAGGDVDLKGRENAGFEGCGPAPLASAAPTGAAGVSVSIWPRSSSNAWATPATASPFGCES